MIWYWLLKILVLFFFADDPNFILKDFEITASEVEKIHDWCMSNLLIVNHSSTSQVLFCNHQKRVDEQFFLIDQLETLQSAKVLGIILEQHLSFVMHINSIVRKLNFLLMMLQYLWKFVNKKCMIVIYYSVCIWIRSQYVTWISCLENWEEI